MIALDDRDIFSVLIPSSYHQNFIALVSGQDNLESDDAFNDHFPSNISTWQTYRLDATTNTFTIGFNQGIAHGLSVDFSALLAQVSADADAEYDRILISASLLKRF